MQFNSSTSPRHARARTLDQPDAMYRAGEGVGREGPALQSAETRATALGWFSVALGLAELTAPRHVAALLSLRDTTRTRVTLRACGARELLAGVALLTRRRRQPWIWARVGGDAMDLALLAAAPALHNAHLGRIALATATVAGITALDIVTGRDLRGEAATRDHLSFATPVVKSITIGATPDAVYRVWRDFANLPRFMAHLTSVEVIDPKISRWVATGPAGTHVTWAAEITEDVPGERIAWRALDGSQVLNAGVVQFLPAPGGRGTEVRVEMRYEPPMGHIGKLVAKLTGEEPAQQIGGDLRRLKQVVELGEVVHSDASVATGLQAGRPSHDGVL